MKPDIGYLVADAAGRPLGCLLFGIAAWKIQARDQFIGWRAGQRRRNLLYLTGNTRFLILPWIRVKCLASHLLAQSLRRLNRDWPLSRQIKSQHFLELRTSGLSG